MRSDPFDTRLQKALALFEARGMRRSTYAPPLFQLLWKLGARVPPPLMAGFGANVLLMGGFFGIFWGALMWVLMWGRQGMPAGAAWLLAGLAGLLFGLMMAAYLRYTAKRQQIPRWRDFHG